MESDLDGKISPAGKNPAISSDRVKAPVASAGPAECVRGHLQVLLSSGPQAANNSTGKNGAHQAVTQRSSVVTRIVFYFS